MFSKKTSLDFGLSMDGSSGLGSDGKPPPGPPTMVPSFSKDMSLDLGLSSMADVDDPPPYHNPSFGRGAISIDLGAFASITDGQLEASTKQSSSNLPPPPARNPTLSSKQSSLDLGAYLPFHTFRIPLLARQCVIIFAVRQGSFMNAPMSIVLERGRYIYLRF
jgi:hypothetical protein